jgi:hypothetical protein
LERGLFAANVPVWGYLISLDFLGFSRPNRDLSMGYKEFPLTSFSRALVAYVGASHRAVAVEAMQEMQDRSSNEPNTISDFLQ